jgi:VWFA-related protein
MPRWLVPTAGWVLCLTALIGARQDRSGAPPLFRTGVELIQLDVSVLDTNRRPVRGLTAADFTVSIDGQRRPVRTFKAFELQPPGPPSGALWMDEVSPDVATNDRPPGRLIAIVIDDGSFNTPNVADLFAIRKAREIARHAVDELQDNDLGAVIFTENSHRSQNFTADRARLLDAIERGPIMPSPSVNIEFLRGAATNGFTTIDAGDILGINRPSCDCGTCSIDTLSRLADELLATPGQRKVIVLVSAGVRVDPQISVPYQAIGANYLFRAEFCNVQRQRAMNDLYRRAGLANVTIQAVDVRGLIPVDRAPGPNLLGVADTAGGIDLRVEFLKAVAKETGGRAIVRNNDMERHVRPLIEDSSFYYLLAVEAPANVNDGRLHAIEVTSSRPDAEVVTRRGYLAPSQEERQRMLSARSDAASAMHGLLAKADVPLELNVVPIADTSRSEGAALAVTISVTQTAPSGANASTDRIKVMAAAFNPETGRAEGSHDHELDVAWKAASGTARRVEVLSRLPVKPGRYEVRVGVGLGDGSSGSVYTYADVPDFKSQTLSLSGLVLSVTPGSLSAPPNTFRDLMPVLPSARRTFRKTDRVTAWLRGYREPDAHGTVTSRLTGADNEVVAEVTEVIETPTGPSTGTFDHQIDLPLDDLEPGEYLFTVEVSAGNDRARRDARFTIR